MPIDFIGAFTKIEWSRLSRILQNQNRFRTHSMGQKMLYMLERKTPGTWVTVLFCRLFAGSHRQTSAAGSTLSVHPVTCATWQQTLSQLTLHGIYGW